MADTISINHLPIEIFLHILKYLDGCTLGKCRRVCRKWINCIDKSDHIWYEMCQKDFEYSSHVAKERCSNEVKWYHIYRNLKSWSNLNNFDSHMNERHKFDIHDTNHLLDLHDGFLHLRDSEDVTFLDLSTSAHVTVAWPNRKCLKVAFAHNTAVFQSTRGILIIRSLEPPLDTTEEFIEANAFVLETNTLYYYCDRDVFQCDLTNEILSPKLLLHCEFNIKEIQHYKGKVHLFTDCGKIVTINKDYSVIVKPINCPVEWIKQIKHIQAVNDKNFVCYSRNLFKIETDQYQHLYLEFPQITALFFYVDTVLIGTAAGEVLLYRLSCQKKGTRPIFETIAELPSGKFATQLEICESRKGPIIIISTFFELYTLHFNFYPHEQLNSTYTLDQTFVDKRFKNILETFPCSLASFSMAIPSTPL